MNVFFPFFYRIDRYDKIFLHGPRLLWQKITGLIIFKRIKKNKLCEIWFTKFFKIRQAQTILQIISLYNLTNKNLQNFKHLTADTPFFDVKNDTLFFSLKNSSQNLILPISDRRTEKKISYSINYQSQWHNSSNFNCLSQAPQRISPQQFIFPLLKSKERALGDLRTITSAYYCNESIDGADSALICARFSSK